MSEITAPPPAPEAVLLTARSVAGLLELGERTLWRWVSDGTFPPPDFRRNARIVRWRRSTVLKWVEKNATAVA